VSAARVALLPALLLVACSHAPPSSPAALPPASSINEWRVATRGEVSALSIGDARVSFCDQAGFHQLEAHTGRVLATGGACPAPSAPASSSPEVTVRTPDLGADDIVEIAGEATSFPIDGHARDWASDAGKVVIVGTGSEVLELLPAANKRERLSDSGASRVAEGGGWAAWWDGAAVVAHRL
jgi:hypothetical protein